MKILFSFFAFICLSSFSYQGSLSKIIVGKWCYQDGLYQYYDDSNRLLGDSKVNELDGLNIEVTKDGFKVLYPNNHTSVGKYSISKEKGKYTVSMKLSQDPFKYQIQSYTKDRLDLVKRQSVNFYVNGDIKQKAAYCIMKISLVRKV